MTATDETQELLPVPNPTASYWRSQPHPLDSHRSTPELPETSDVVIIGAGLAGVAVAYHLSKSKTPPSSILILEARQTCSGATGRNGGHVKVKAATQVRIAEQASPATADTVSRFFSAQIGAIKETVEKEDIDCEFEVRRSYDVFTSARDADEMEQAFRRCRDRGDKWTREVAWVGPEWAERLTSVQGAQGAFNVPACSLWPYKFVTGLLERTMAAHPGLLNLQTETPVLRVQEVVEQGLHGDGSTITVVHTPRGSVRAQKVVFATNAYTGALLPEYRGIITPYKGTAAHLAALDGREPVFPHLSHTYNIEYGLKPGSETVDYLNPRPDGGIVVGGGRWVYEDKEVYLNTVDDSTVFDSVAKAGYFDNYMQRTFKGWKDSGAEAERVWTGIMGSTPDGYPHIGKVPGKKGQWILAGFNGGGMSIIFLSAKGVAEMVTQDVPFSDNNAGIPDVCETTEQRLNLE